MTNAKTPNWTDLNALAIEACDMWQDYLGTLAADPSARAQLTHFLEPQRKLWADWASVVQKGGAHGTAANAAGEQPPHDAHAIHNIPDTGAAPPRDAATDGDAFRAFLLAERVADLEKRLGQIESLILAATRRTEP